MHANEVIRVHDRVDETVEHNGQVDVSVVVENRVEPVEEEDCRVVVDVQERELLGLLAQHNEHWGGGGARARARAERAC